MEQTQWLVWARKLQAIAQTGLFYCENQFDQERYESIQELAAEMMAAHSDLDKQEILRFKGQEVGYATPKVDVRGVVFRDNKLLLVREVADQGRWTLPGGWADVNDSPAEAVEREIYEESGFKTIAEKVLAVYDREKQGNIPAYPEHIYKLFFRCRIVGGEATTSNETSEIRFFSEEELPEDVSEARVLRSQMKRCFHLKDAPTDFDSSPEDKWC